MELYTFLPIRERERDFFLNNKRISCVQITEEHLDSCRTVGELSKAV